MELRSVSGQVNVAQIANMKPNSGRISLPVSRAQSPYAQFKYVQGVPTKSPGGSVSINRLRVLNTLINSIVTRSENPGLHPEISKMSDESVKALIGQYSSQLHSALKASTPYAAAGSAYTGGSLFNVLA
ncbi:hypothetical protein [Oceanispirochaeta sp.]|jgi:hypothetical protein|uniref:hypothetical protein n=1 Tax=Oceanispirochaeta sp. TaxID=2035350 RepID=UPI00262420E3|nr:hypothetical protein [Oceanispirochaeta sp.]MDA3956394.1 hypothetical protein [Oceanispirochaeta sp.]